MGVTNPQSPIPNPRSLHPLPPSPFPLPPRGFTLIEMLIVITITLVLVAAAATHMQPAMESRRVRETARQINVYLGSARNRAMETGRPCGVTLHRFVITPGPPAVACVMSLDICEVPPCYCGDTETSMANITWTGVGNTLSVTFTDGALSTGLVRPGDLIQFNGQGLFYRVADTVGTTTNPVDTNGYLTGVGTISLPLTITFDNTQGQLIPWNTTARTVPYRILRADERGCLAHAVARRRRNRHFPIFLGM